jgi:predicted P-loop ATPase
VLEGLKDAGKSSAVRVLGDPWFTDALKLGSDGKLTIEQTIGSWIVEAAELAGMEKREVEAIKAQVTCRQDRARLAYGHYTSTIPRQWIVVGTTKEIET